MIYTSHVQKRRRERRKECSATPLCYCDEADHNFLGYGHFPHDWGELFLFPWEINMVESREKCDHNAVAFDD